MLLALGRAFADLATPALRRILWICLALAVASFAVLWVAVTLALAQIAWFGWRPLDWLVDLLGTLAVLVISWLLFPAVVTMVIGLFLDRIAAAIEAHDYPDRGPARRAPLAQTIMVSLRLMAFTILANLLALPVYLLLPGINFFVFFGLNGYLLGREYFEVVALRRLEPSATRALRRRFAARVFLGGVVIAGLFALPLVNLLAPVVATAFMLHLFEALRRGEHPLCPS